MNQHLFVGNGALGSGSCSQDSFVYTTSEENQAVLWWGTNNETR